MSCVDTRGPEAGAAAGLMCSLCYTSWADTALDDECIYFNSVPTVDTVQDSILTVKIPQALW